MNIMYKPIGTIHSPFSKAEGVPIQPTRAEGIRGTVELLKEYVSGLKDLDGFSNIILLYHFHLSKGYSMDVIPFLDDKAHGVFATRTPKRPNPIGLSVVKLIQIENNILHIENVDIVDQTPLLDIKPYVREFENPGELKIGWLTDKIEAR